MFPFSYLFSALLLPWLRAGAVGLWNAWFSSGGADWASLIQWKPLILNQHMRDVISSMWRQTNTCGCTDKRTETYCTYKETGIQSCRHTCTHTHKGSKNACTSTNRQRQTCACTHKCISIYLHAPTPTNRYSVLFSFRQAFLARPW